IRRTVRAGPAALAAKAAAVAPGSRVSTHAQRAAPAAAGRTHRRLPRQAKASATPAAGHTSSTPGAGGEISRATRQAKKAIAKTASARGSPPPACWGPEAAPPPASGKGPVSCGWAGSERNKGPGSGAVRTPECKGGEGNRGRGKGEGGREKGEGGARRPPPSRHYAARSSRST